MKIHLCSLEFEAKRIPCYWIFTLGDMFPVHRYVATSVTSVHPEMENGFNIWSFNGKLLYRILKDHFFQVILINIP